MYLDDQGNSIRTRKYGSIPPEKRNSVITYQDCSSNFAKKPSFSYTQEAREKTTFVAETVAETGIIDWFRDRHRRLERWQVIVMLVSLAVLLGGLIGIAVAAFRISVLWGLGVLFLPIVPVVFIAMYWRDTRVPFGAWLVGWIVLALVGYVI
jgi:hypothetical protein